MYTFVKKFTERPLSFFSEPRPLHGFNIPFPSMVYIVKNKNSIFNSSADKYFSIFNGREKLWTRSKRVIIRVWGVCVCVIFFPLCFKNQPRSIVFNNGRLDPGCGVKKFENKFYVIGLVGRVFVFLF